MGTRGLFERFTAPFWDGIFVLPRAISSAGERCLHTAEVAGSKPASPTPKKRRFAGRNAKLRVRRRAAFAPFDDSSNTYERAFVSPVDKAEEGSSHRFLGREIRSASAGRVAVLRAAAIRREPERIP